VAHFPVAEEHFIERGEGLAGDVTVAQQEAGRALGALQLTAKRALKRDGPQPLSQRLRLFDSALG
jgi:hypothetical protein